MKNETEKEDKEQAKKKLNANRSKIKLDAKKVEVVLQTMKGKKNLVNQWCHSI